MARDTHLHAAAPGPRGAEAPLPAASARAAWGACLAATLGLVAMLAWTGTTVAPAAIAVPAALTAALALPCLVYARLRPHQTLSNLCGGLAVLIWSGGANAFTALAALRTKAPFMDPTLAAADAMLGLDTQALVTWAAGRPPLGTLLGIAYGSTVPAVFAVVAFLALSGREARMWECAFAFAAGSTFCAVALAFWPAVAAFAHYGKPAAVLEGLPAASGVFHLAIVEALRSDAILELRLDHIEGVATFPSFHATMACIIAFGMRGTGAWFALAAAWGALIMVSTIVIGGHFAVDLLAGIALWAACVAAVRPMRGRARLAGAARRPAS